MTKNEAAFEQIKCIQQLYDLCEEKYKDSIVQKTKFQDKGAQTDIRPKLVPICRKCRNLNDISNNCLKEATKTKKKTIFRKFINLYT